MSHGGSDAAGEVRVVRGEPTPDELAALSAVLSRAAGGPEPTSYEAAPTPYEAWRAGRLAALRADPRRPVRPKPTPR